MKHILFLDDDPRRTSEIRSYMTAFDCALTTVETSDGCIEALQSSRYDLVLLDHDLGGETFVDSNRQDTGMEVVRWLKNNGGDHAGFIIHTMNAVAAAGMYITLKSLNYRTGQAPFGSRDFFLLVNEFLDEQPPAKQRRSLSARLGDYFRSIRRS